MTSKDRTDANLIAKAKAGDLDAFDQLIARHRIRVLAIARQIAGNPEAAQDIAQDAFLNAYRSLASLHDQLRFGPWLNTIVRRQAQRFLRDGHRTPEPMDCEMVHIISGGWPQPEPEPPAEVVERLRAALEILTRRERKVMILHYLEGRTCEEIAAQLHLPTGSVKRILYNSRQKAKKESIKMAQEEKVKKGPRLLDHWIAGSTSAGRDSVFTYMRSPVTQSVCLVVNKTAKTSRQIAAEIDANAKYVEDAISDLMHLRLLESPKKGLYLDTFIAFDAGDWRRLMTMIKEPAARIAAQLVKTEAKVKAAYKKTPLAASGLTWQEVIWPLYSVAVVNFGVSRNRSERDLRGPERPDGYYWFGGHELDKDLSPTWSTGFNSSGSWPTLRHGNFWTEGLRWNYNSYPHGDSATAIELLALKSLSEKAALNRLKGETEHWRGILADLMRTGLLKKESNQLRLAIPVFTQADSELLTPVIDEIIRPIVRDIAEPAFADVDKLLDEMGYSHRRDQYPQWHRWLIGNVMGEALRFMMEQGVLPKPPDPVPATFAFIAWKGDLPLMSWGVK